jgi:hypothetical protein
MFHNIIMLLSKPPAGFYHAQSQISPETQYLTPYLTDQPAGGVVAKISRTAMQQRFQLL